MLTFSEFLRSGALQEAEVDLAKIADPAKSVKGREDIIRLIKAGHFAYKSENTKTITAVFNKGNTEVFDTLDIDQVDSKNHYYMIYKAASGKNVKLISTGSKVQNGKVISVNKGSTFEKEVLAMFQNFIAGAEPTPLVQKVMAVIEAKHGAGWEVIEAVNDGKKCTRRPLTFKGDLITAGVPKPNYDIGADVTDVTLKLQRAGKTITEYLSCKESGTIAFANIGIKTLITDKEIATGEITGDGLKLLEAFCVDPVLFCRVFNEYKKGTKEKIKPLNITTALRKSKGFNSFFKSSIGCGYIKVEPKEVLRIEPTTLKQMTVINSATISYPIGTGKQVKIEIDTNFGTLLARFRNTSGGAYPNKLTIDRKAKK